MAKAVILAAVSAFLTVVAGDACNNSVGVSCGDSTTAYCCQDNLYCMPWNLGYYQCVALPAQCARQFTNYDFYGGDIKTIYGLQPGDCCATCLATEGCLAYTFNNEYSGTTACFLKAGMGSPRVTPGLISAVIDSYTSDQDKTPKLRRFLAETNDTDSQPDPIKYMIETLAQEK
ncbi:hypothetical protein PHYBOEH_011997 [Phytophthora boehmeriae]|uniref:Apple domain-containing protein n=1 Tax=Phytophthora boehmeriae TaxID=109152 RepID=A0A8T1X2I7_9STRA|nr:hypothetical protein PHYBOEH_011997 [Phytophthora boehmeriae]